jgi:hypothetical protein
MTKMKGTFKDWVSQVNRVLLANVGVTLDDLPDCCYRDWYDDGVSPVRAARMALTESEE